MIYNMHKKLKTNFWQKETNVFGDWNGGGEVDQ